MILSYNSLTQSITFFFAHYTLTLYWIEIISIFDFILIHSFSIGILHFYCSFYFWGAWYLFQTDEFPNTGVEIKVASIHGCIKSSRIFLVASPPLEGIVSSVYWPIDWVRFPLVIYLNTHKLSKHIKSSERVIDTWGCSFCNLL